MCNSDKHVQSPEILNDPSTTLKIRINFAISYHLILRPHCGFANCLTDVHQSRIMSPIQLSCLFNLHSGQVPQSFLDFHDCYIFEYYRPRFWGGWNRDIPPFMDVWCFLVVRFRLRILGKTITINVMRFSCLVVHDFNLSHYRWYLLGLLNEFKFNFLAL